MKVLAYFVVILFVTQTYPMQEKYIVGLEYVKKFVDQYKDPARKQTLKSVDLQKLFQQSPITIDDIFEIAYDQTFMKNHIYRQTIIDLLNLIKFSQNKNNDELNGFYMSQIVLDFLSTTVNKSSRHLSP